MTGLLDLKVESSLQGMPVLCTAAKGEKPWPDVYVDAGDLDGAALDIKFDAADADAAAHPTDSLLRMNAAYAYAVARDYKYACAESPLFHFGHGLQSTLRNLYCGAALTINATTV